MTDDEIQVVRFCREIRKLLKRQEKNPRYIPLWFDPNFGLCLNFKTWTNSDNYHKLTEIVRWEVAYPFGNYWASGEREQYTIYENPDRLAFINEWADKRLRKPKQS